jgi:hypothetical protein
MRWKELSQQLYQVSSDNDAASQHVGIKPKLHRFPWPLPVFIQFEFAIMNRRALLSVPTSRRT